MSLNEQQLVRRENLNKIKAAGVDPFPPELFEITHFAKEIKSDFLEGSTKFKHVKLAGRLMMKRLMGKASFAELQDSSGKIQIYVARDEICPDPENRTFYNGVFSKWMDIGDFIGIEGHVFKTRTGETTVHVEKLVLLSKSLNPLPVVKVDSEGVVHDALTDPEIRYRQRYIDLLVNPRIKEIFKKRGQLITAMRNFFDEQGWLEVETPILQPIHGGAAARPFKTHHNSLDMTLYLRIANELYLKRLIVGGYDGVYEIGKMFRNEGMDRTHNPEFTALEIYVAYKDYNWMMEMVEQLIEKIAIKLHHTTKVTYGEHILDFKGPYPRMSMYEAIQKYIQVDISDMDENQLRALCREHHVEVDNTMGRGKLIDELFGEKVEDHLIQPTYITDYPIEMTPLAKKHRTVDGLVERFELFVNGKEIANAYTELNDPLDQRARFEEQLVLANRGDAEAMALDDDYLLALEHGMPPTSGLGIGIDRLVMLMTDQHSIQEVLFFPQMKAKE